MAPSPEPPQLRRPAWRWIAAGKAEAFAQAVLAPGRTRPIVAVTTSSRTGDLPLDADRLARRLAGHADVVAFETGAATWALSNALPARLDVYGGAARIWWPGVARTSAPHDHPLILVVPGQAKAIEQRIVATIRGVVGSSHPPKALPHEGANRIGDTSSRSAPARKRAKLSKSLDRLSLSTPSGAATAVCPRCRGHFLTSRLAAHEATCRRMAIATAAKLRPKPKGRESPHRAQIVSGGLPSLGKRR